MQIDDRHGALRAERGKCLIREGPVMPARPEQRAVQLRPVAQVAAADLADQGEILAPAVVMAALRHLVTPYPAAIQGGGAVLNSGGEQEALR